MEPEYIEDADKFLIAESDALYGHNTPMIRIPSSIKNLLAMLYPDEEIKKRIKKCMRNIVEYRRHERAEEYRSGK